MASCAGTRIPEGVGTKGGFDSSRFSPLLENLRLMQVNGEPPPIARKPRDNPESRGNSSTGTPNPGSRRDSISSPRPRADSRQYQAFQTQRLQYWEQRHRIQQQRKEIELLRKASQSQQLAQLYQQQQQRYAVQLQHQQMSMQRQMMQQMAVKQQLEGGKKGARRSSAPAAPLSGHGVPLSAAAVSRGVPPMVVSRRHSSLQHGAEQAVPTYQGVVTAGWAPSRSRRVSRPPLVTSFSAPATGYATPEAVSPVSPISYYGPSLAYYGIGMPGFVTSPGVQPSQSPGLSLMTDEEKDWIKRLQRQSVPAADTIQHFNSDYYHIKLCERRARREGKPLEPLVVTENARNTEDQVEGLHGNHLDSSSCSQSWRASLSRATKLPGTLGGQVSAGSARFPKLVIDLEGGESANGRHGKFPYATETMSYIYRPLMAIEEAFEHLLRLEEQERQTSVPKGDSLLISQPERREQALLAMMTALGFGSSDSDLMKHVLLTQKGVFLIARVLPALPVSLAQQVSIAAFQHLSEVDYSEDCDVDGIRSILARSLTNVLKQSSSELLTVILEHLVTKPQPPKLSAQGEAHQPVKKYHQQRTISTPTKSNSITVVRLDCR